MAKLTSKGRLDNALRIVSDISEDGQATNVIFDNFHIHFEQSHQGLLTVEKVAVVTFEVENAETDIGISTVLRGFINVTGSGSATLITHICGETQIGQLPDMSSKGKDFSCCFKSLLAVNHDYRAVIILLAERNSNSVEAGITLSIDSMDLEFDKAT